MESDISVRALTMTIEDIWSSSEIQKAQLEVPVIKPILEKKLNSSNRPFVAVFRRLWTISARNRSGESCNKMILGSLGLLTS
ncbi:hypothetical protein AVEN_67091-1 [Araneus ventricosus]|uniref:Uncharacterized protein n=1 Tax=Araneus ventricosus TaxID=182803 RepID=A0A4Y2FQ00_ARAVE|nr:hypothetical protein AVEN_67091-1 [Araneus ventricosus]